LAMDRCLAERRPCIVFVILIILMQYSTAAPTQICDPFATKRLPQGVKLRLIRHGWLSHKLVTQVAAILLQEELKYDVEIIDPSALPEASRPLTQDYKSLAEGLFDANFELWRSSEKLADYQKYVTNTSGAVHLSEHAILSYLGVYVPRYAFEADNRLGFFQFLRKPEAQDRFSEVTMASGEAAGDVNGKCETSDWNCVNYVWSPSYCGGVASTSCRATLLRGDLDYSFALLEQRFAGNNLSASFVYTTMATMYQTVWDAYADRKTFMFYSWEPIAPIYGIASTEFVRIKFPPPGISDCTEPGLTPLGGGRCDGPPTPLQKVVSQRLASSADARYFAFNFRLTSEHYEQLFAEYEGADSNVFNGACRWLNRHKNEWTPFVKYTKPAPWIPIILSVSGCWGYVWTQLFIVLSLQLFFDCLPLANIRKKLKLDEEQTGTITSITTAMLTPRNPKSRSKCFNAEAEANERGEEEPMNNRESSGNTPIAMQKLGTTVCQMGTETGHLFKTSAQTGKKITELTLGLHTNAKAFENVLAARQLDFLKYRRSETNFIKMRGWFQAPNEGHQVFRLETGTYLFLQLFWYVMRSSMRTTVLRSCQYALLVGTAGTVVHILKINALENNSLRDWSAETEKFVQVVSDFKMLPSLLLVFKVMSHIARWSTWVGHCGSISGRLGDLSLVVGSFEGVNGDIDLPLEESLLLSERVRRAQFDFYRYLNSIHYLCYYCLDHRIPEDPMECCDGLHQIGLLTEDERDKLVESVRGGLHTTLLTWVSVLWHKEIESYQPDGDNHPNAGNFMEKLMALRTSIGCLRTASDFDREPDVTNGMLYLVTYALLFFVMCAYPFTFYTKTTGCFQPFSIGASFLFMFSYHGLVKMQDILGRCPFNIGGDCVNVDTLLVDTEEMIFTMIRAGYADENNIGKEEDTNAQNGDSSSVGMPTSRLWRSVSKMPPSEQPSTLASATRKLITASRFKSGMMQVTPEDEPELVVKPEHRSGSSTGWGSLLSPHGVPLPQLDEEPFLEAVVKPGHRSGSSTEWGSLQFPAGVPRPKLPQLDEEPFLEAVVVVSLNSPRTGDCGQEGAPEDPLESLVSPLPAEIPIVASSSSQNVDQVLPLNTCNGQDLSEVDNTPPLSLPDVISPPPPSQPPSRLPLTAIEAGAMEEAYRQEIRRGPAWTSPSQQVGRENRPETNWASVAPQLD